METEKHKTIAVHELSPGLRVLLLKMKVVRSLPKRVKIIVITEGDITTISLVHRRFSLRKLRARRRKLQLPAE